MRISTHTHTSGRGGAVPAGVLSEVHGGTLGVVPAAQRVRLVHLRVQPHLRTAQRRQRPTCSESGRARSAGSTHSQRTGQTEPFEPPASHAFCVLQPTVPVGDFGSFHGQHRLPVAVKPFRLKRKGAIAIEPRGAVLRASTANTIATEAVDSGARHGPRSPRW